MLPGGVSTGQSWVRLDGPGASMGICGLRTDTHEPVPGGSVTLPKPAACAACTDPASRPPWGVGTPFVEDRLPPGGRGQLTPGLRSVGLALLPCNEMLSPAKRGSRGKGALLGDVGCVREWEWGRQQEAEAGLPGACWDAAEMGEALRGVRGALRREPGIWGGWGGGWPRGGG